MTTYRNFPRFRHLGEEDWLSRRKHYVNASELQYSLDEPWGFWNRKHGNEEPWVSERYDLADLGTGLEPVVAEWFRREFPEYLVIDPGKHAVVSSGQLSCTPDRVLIKDGWCVAVLECKTAWHDKGRKWQDGIVPRANILQICQTMQLCNVEYGYIGVFAPMVPLVKFVRVDLALHKPELQEAQKHALDLLKSKDPPEIDGSVECKKYIEAEEAKKPWECNLEPIAEVVAERDKIQKLCNKLYTEKERLNNLIRLEMGSASIGKLNDGSGFTYKTGARGRQLRRFGA